MTNYEPFLILHRVRGLPTFDIAIRDPHFEDRWLRPADDRRVFPVETWSVEGLLLELGIGEWNMPQIPEDHSDCAYPETWPDYNPRNAKIPKAESTQLLMALGLSTKVHNAVQGTLKRRI